MGYALDAEHQFQPFIAGFDGFWRERATLATKLMVAGIRRSGAASGSAGLHRQVSACPPVRLAGRSHIDVAEIDHIQHPTACRQPSPGSATRYCTRPSRGAFSSCHRYLRQCAVQWLVRLRRELRLNDIGACRFYSRFRSRYLTFADSSAARALSAAARSSSSVAQK